jgi:nucleoside-diphosphate-sugar epimerase
MARDGFATAWARVFFVYGPYEQTHRLVPSVIRALLAGEPANTSHANQIRDYLYAEDVASALVALLESDYMGPVNIGSGEPIRLRTIIDRIGQLLGRSELIRIGAVPPATTDKPFVVADTARLRSLDWAPKWTLDDGLRAAIEFWRHHVSPAEVHRG